MNVSQTPLCIEFTPQGKSGYSDPHLTMDGRTEHETVPVDVAGYPNLSNVIHFCPAFDIWICTKCRKPVAKSKSGSHLATEHGDELWPPGALKKGQKQLDERCLALRNELDSLHKVGTEIGGGEWSKVHKRVPFLNVTEGHTGRACLDANCFFVSASLTTTIKHLKDKDNRHKVSTAGDDNELVLPRHLQTLDLGGKKRIMVQPRPVAGSQEVAVEQTRRGYGSMPEFEEAFAAPPPRPPRTRDLDPRRQALIELVTNWRNVLTQDQIELARWLLSKDNALVAGHIRSALEALAQKFLEEVQRRIPKTPENLRVVMASGSATRLIFKETEHVNKNYKKVIASLLQWALTVWGPLGPPSGANAEHGTEEEEEDFDLYLEQFGLYHEIPDHWALNGELISESINKLYELVRSDHVPQNRPDSVPEEPFAVVSKVLLALLARTARLSDRDEGYYDPMAVFCVATTLLHKDVSRTGANATTFMAGLEYAMRSCVLLEANEIYKSITAGMAQPGGVATASPSMEASRYIKENGIADAERNNVAFLLSHHKGRLRNHAPNEATSNIQFKDHADKKDLIIADTAVEVNYGAVKAGIDQVFVDVEADMRRLLGGYTGSRNFCNLVENWNDETVGYSFVTDKRNGLADLWKAYGCQCPFKSPAWRKDFLATTHGLMEKFGFLIHTAAGGPSRAPTMVSAQLVNSMTMLRCLQIFGKDVMFVTRYNGKGRSLRQRDIESAKCLPSRLASPLLQYLVLLRPVENRLRASVDGAVLPDLLYNMETYFFVTPEGRPFDEAGSQFRSLIKRFFNHYMRADIRFQDWRHAQENWQRHQIPDVACARGIRASHVLNSQMDHSKATGDLYGRADSEPVSTEFFANNAFGSKAWHRFILVNHTDCPVQPVHLPEPDTLLGQGDTHAAAANPSVINYNIDYHFGRDTQTSYRSSEVCVGELQKILSAARRQKMYPTLFRNKDTEKCFHTVFSSRDDFVVLLPTGSGKTSFVHYPSMWERTERDVVLVIVPLLPLLRDQVRAAKKKGIHCHLYDPALTPAQNKEVLNLDAPGPTKRVVFVQLEHVGPHFLEFSALLGTRLGRIIKDEWHLILFHDSLRGFDFHYVEELCNQLNGVPKLILTATLPYAHREEFLKRVSVWKGTHRVEPRVLDYSRIPPNVSFSVEWESSATGVREHIFNAASAFSPQRQTRERIIIFCMTIEDLQLMCNYLEARGIRCAQSHSNLTEEERVNYEKAWREGKFWVIVATDGFACGVDYPYIPMVFNAHGGWDLASLIQKGGRAARAHGTLGKFVFVGCKQHYLGQSFYADQAEKALRNWLLNDHVCRRCLLSLYLSNTAELCTEETSPCDICRHNLPLLLQQESAVTLDLRQDHGSGTGRDSELSCADQDAVPAERDYLLGDNGISVVGTKVSQSQSDGSAQSQDWTSEVYVPPDEDPTCLPTGKTKSSYAPPEQRKRQKLVLPPSQEAVKKAASASLASTNAAGVARTLETPEPLTSGVAPGIHPVVTNPYKTTCSNGRRKPLPANPHKSTRPDAPRISTQTSASTAVTTERSLSLQADNHRQDLCEVRPHLEALASACPYCYVKSGTVANHVFDKNCPSRGRRQLLCFRCTGNHGFMECIVARPSELPLSGNSCRKCLLLVSEHHSGPSGFRCYIQPKNDFTHRFCWAMLHHKPSLLREIISDRGIPTLSGDFGDWMATAEGPPGTPCNGVRLLCAYIKIQPWNRGPHW